MLSFLEFNSFMTDMKSTINILHCVAPILKSVGLEENRNCICSTCFNKIYFLSHLKGFLQFILVEFRGSVAANVWAEAVESAVVNLLHQTKHFQGNLCALYLGYL